MTYHLPRYTFDASRIFTNKPPCGPKRGHGTVQSRFVQEVQMDKIAAKLKMDPAELRLNIVEESDTLTANFLKIGSIGLKECINRIMERSDWKNKYNKMPCGKGIGIACSSYLTGAGNSTYWNKMPHTGVQLKLDRSGKVTVYCGATDVGHGSDDVLVNMVTEVLGITAAEVRCVTGDTDLTPVDLGSYSSRVTLMMGNAAIQAAERARDIIAKAASAKLKVPEERLVFADSRVFDSQDLETGLTFQKAMVSAEEVNGTVAMTDSYAPPEPSGKYKGGGVGPSHAYSYSAAIVEIDVDPETGWITVPRVYIGHDLGRSLNPILADGQIIGGVYMGLGEVLMEEQAFHRLSPRLSEALVHKGPSLLDYKTLLSRDMPEVFVDIIEDPDPNGPFGAKEAGQGPLIPVIPALVNAIHDAVGVRIDEVPVSPEKILKAIADKEKGGEGRVDPGAFPEVDWPEPFKVPPPWEGGDGNATNEPKLKRAVKMHKTDQVASS